MGQEERFLIATLIMAVFVAVILYLFITLFFHLPPPAYTS